MKHVPITDRFIAWLIDHDRRVDSPPPLDHATKVHIEKTFDPAIVAYAKAVSTLNLISFAARNLPRETVEEIDKLLARIQVYADTCAGHLDTLGIQLAQLLDGRKEIAAFVTTDEKTKRTRNENH